MIVTSQLFEAYIECPTKCWLRSRGEPTAGNVYAEWTRAQNEVYRRECLKNLLATLPKSNCAMGPPISKNSKDATWRIAIDVRLRTNYLESRPQAVEKTASEGRGSTAQFIPYRFEFVNKLTKKHKLLLAFDAVVLAEVVGRAVNLGKIVHGDSHTAPVARMPTFTVSNDPNASRGQTVALSSLISIADPDNVGYQKLELWDSAGTVGGSQFAVNGTPQTGGHEIDISLANVANTVFDVGMLGGADRLWAQLLQNNGQLTGWQPFTVTVPQASLSVHSVGSATKGQVINLSTLVTVLDPGNVGYQKLELWDSTGTAAGGRFVIGGVAQTGGHEIDITSGNVAALSQVPSGLVFDAGTASGTSSRPTDRSQAGSPSV